MYTQTGVSEWLEVLSGVCFLSFITFRSKETAETSGNSKLKRRKKTRNPKTKDQGNLKGFIVQESGFIFERADGAEKQKAADSPCFWSRWAMGAVRPAQILDPAGQIPGWGEPRLRFISAVSHYPYVLLEQHQNTVLGVL